jgi:hypothetical protein
MFSFLRSRRLTNKNDSHRHRGARLMLERLENRELLDATPAQFVTGLYYDVLHRSPSPAELAAWTGVLSAGHTRGELATGFVTSGEYRFDLIRHYYNALLGREPEATATATWLHAMTRGMSEQSLLLNIVVSDEYFQRNGGTNVAWVTALYQDVLGRVPDAGPLSSWTRQLNLGIPRGTIALEIVFSPEKDIKIIASTYQAILGRNPDTGAAVAWFAAFQQGMGKEQLLESLVSSNEYLNQQSEVTSSDVGSGGTDFTVLGAPALTVTLQVPASASSANPTITVIVNDPNFAGRVRIDVDAQGDVNFANPADLSQTTVLINPQKHSFMLNSLGTGTYAVRARVFDAFANVFTSETATITIS